MRALAFALPMTTSAASRQVAICACATSAASASPVPSIHGGVSGVVLNRALRPRAKCPIIAKV